VNRKRQQGTFIRFDDQRRLHRYANKICALRSIDTGTTTTLGLSSGSRLQQVLKRRAFRVAIEQGP
jgi:hypothetical protein